MAANAPNTIKLQKVESELTVQFQIDDLHSAFTRSSASKYTEHFGPGLRFGSYSFVDGSEPSHIGLYLYTSKEYPGLAIHWAVATKSLNGAQTYQTKQMAYTFRAGEAIGWSKFLTADMFHAHGALRADNAMAVHATLRFVPVWPIVLRPTLDVLHRAVVGRAPPHVRFVAYARRDANGRLSAPAAFFATRAAVAQRSDIFADLCDGGFTPLSGSRLKAHEQPKSTAYTTYRDDDSDFEDDTTDNESEDLEMVDAQLHARPSADTGESYGDSATLVVKSEPVSAASTLASPSDDLSEHSGTTIVVLGAPARTWEAVLYWVYTGTIVFAPLSSAGRAERAAFLAQHAAANPDRPRAVSCKSVYRIADALRLDSLKKRAMDHLLSQLTMHTYLHELFSEFTSRYDDVRKVQLLAVIKHWDALKGSAALKEKMQDVVRGRLPHAGALLADLLMRTSIKESLDAAAAGPQAK